MKILKVALALSLGAAVFTSCNNSGNTGKNQNVANPLTGEWKIDSVATKDSNGIGVLLLAMSLHQPDSNNHDVSFTSDTVMLHLKDSLTKTAYQFNTEKKELLLQTDSTVLTYENINDSIISLTAKDSTIIFLKKYKL